MIHLHTLGDALIRVGEKEVRPTAPLLFAALLYLGLERGRRVPRTALQELFFPDVDERSGAHSLRQLLYKLRQLGAPLEADAATVGLPVDQVRDDAVVELVTNGHSNGIEKYGRGFLPDYAPKLSERYGEWLEQRREAVVSSVRRQLIGALKASREGMNWPAVEKYAHLILELDAFNEEATLALAEATALTGAKAKALEILTRYERETGRTDLRLPPALLKRRISEGTPRRSAATTRFVGRDAEAEALRNQILQARSGNPSLVVIAGEAGIGKTRLVEEATALAALEGIQVHVVRCQPHYASRPLSVFIDLVPSLLAAPGALGVSPDSLQQLKLLTKHVDNRNDDPRGALDNTTQSEVLLASVRDLVDAVVSEVPTAFVIEDAQRADPDSLRELCALAGTASRLKLAVVFTTRAVDPLKKVGVISDSTPVRRLRPLADEPMHALAYDLLPAFQSQAKEVAAWCTQTAAGNPLFLQMLCRHYRETGQSYAVPPDLRTATTQRIEQLPPDCRRLLQFSALLGRHATLDALQSLTECTELQLLSRVERLEEEGYLRIDGESARVAHDLLTECTLAVLTPLARKVMHRSVAANLERRYDETNEAVMLWDCAEQWGQSGDVGKALTFLKRCAQHACRIGQAREAMKLLQHAKGIAVHPLQTADILGEMMDLACWENGWHDIERFAEERSVIHQTLGTTPSAHTRQEGLSIAASWILHWDSVEVTRRLLLCIRAADASPEHRVGAALDLLTIAHERCDGGLAEEAYHSVEGLGAFASIRNGTRLVPLYYHAIFGDRQRASILATEFERDLPSLQPLVRQFKSAWNLATMLQFLGCTDQVVRVGRSYYERAVQLRLTVWPHELSAVICAGLCVAERWEEALTWYAIASAGAPTDDRGVMSQPHVANGIELAIGMRDADLARKRFDLARKDIGDCLRWRAYLRAHELRISQLDPAFQVDAKAFEEVLALFEKVKRFSSADWLAMAIGEEFRRRGAIAELRILLDEYVESSRRELSPIPPTLAKLRALHSGTAAQAAR